jgi:hypothetical protein
MISFHFFTLWIFQTVCLIMAGDADVAEKQTVSVFRIEGVLSKLTLELLR